MRPPKQKQPQVKKGLCRVLEHVDVDVDVYNSQKSGYLAKCWSLTQTQTPTQTPSCIF